MDEQSAIEYLRERGYVCLTQEEANMVRRFIRPTERHRQDQREQVIALLTPLEVSEGDNPKWEDA